MNKGVVTSTDSNCFVAFQLFYYGLKKSNPELPLVVFNLGLNKKEKKWFEENSINLIEYKNPIVSKNIFMWQTWNKVDYILKSPFDYTLWLDSDTIIYNKLDKLFEIMKKRIACIKDFCGVSTNNHPNLYKIYPVNNRLEINPNGGVLGVYKKRKKDIDFLNQYLFLTKKAAKSKKLRSVLSWWDQGIINWALEKSKNTNVVINDLEYNDTLYDPSLRIQDPIVLYEKLKSRKTSIVHLAGCPKPYFWFEKNLNRSPIEKNLKVFITGHNEDCLRKIPNKNFIKKINLSNLEIGIKNTEDLAENRFFLSDQVFRSHEPYIGLITHRYKEKYNLEIENLNKITKKIEKNYVFTCHFARKDWYDYSINYHPGMEKYLKEISKLFDLPIRKKHVFWANNFICHKSIFADFIFLFRSIFIYMNKKYGYDFNYKVDPGQEHRKAAFLYERVAMMYFSNQDNLKIIQIPYAKSGYDKVSPINY